MHSRLALFALAAAATIALPRAAAAQVPALNWGPAPPVFQPGSRMAVLHGNPGEAGLFTVRLEMPSGYQIAPHFHPMDELVTVISGTLLVGTGDSLDAGRARTLRPGDFIALDANLHHWAIARGRTVIQVHCNGPFALTYINPRDNPQPSAGN